MRARSAVTLRRLAVRSSVGESRPETSSTACRSPRRSRSTATVLPNETRAGASKRIVWPRAVAWREAIAMRLAGRSSVACVLICAGPPAIFCPLACARMASALRGPESCTRAVPVILPACTPSAASVASTRMAPSGSLTRASSASRATAADPGKPAWSARTRARTTSPLPAPSMATSASKEPVSACPVSRRRSSSRAMRSLIWPVGSLAPVASVRAPSAWALFQSARSIRTDAEPSGARLTSAARLSGDPSSVPTART